MTTYPIMLHLAGRRCVVVGARPVGTRKARSLARCGARVRLVDPQAPEAPGEGIEPLPRPYAPDLLAGAVLVFACTDDAALNARIAGDARRAGALANAADQPDDCDFFVPAVAGDGEVVLAVGTGGAAPALARRLSGELAAALPPRVGEFAAALAAARKLVRRRCDDRRRRRRILTELAGPGGYKLFAAGGRPALLDRAERLLEAT